MRRFAIKATRGDDVMTKTAPLILIVEDDFANNKLMAEVLSMHGYRVEATHDGQDALALFGTMDPALVIMDVGIPTIDGFEVCRRMRLQSDVPILMVTGRANPGTVNRLMDGGASGCMAKPYDIVELVQRVEEVIKSSPEPHSASSQIRPANAMTSKFGGLEGIYA